MKIAFTANGSDLDATIDRRFGRAERFVIVDSDDESFAVIDNTQNLNAAQGAGIQAAQNVAASGATVLITGHTGPKAFRVLSAAGIGIWQAREESIRQNLAAWKAGTLVKLDDADVEGHWV